MNVVVSDASALVEYLLRTPRAFSIHAILSDTETDLHVPALCDLEVAAGFRRAMLNGAMSEERLAQALEDYLDLPITRHGHADLLHRVMSLRRNVSVYDAAYLALAEALSAAFLTVDDRLARATRSHTSIPTLPRLPGSD